MIDLQEPNYDYDKFLQDTKNLANQYEQLITCVTIGESHDNRDIVLLTLGVGKKYMICCGGVHARESVNPIVLLRIIEYYADLYVNHKEQKISLKRRLSHPNLNLQSEYEQMLYGACIYELLQTYTILFVPLINPDGYMIALQGFDSIRNQKLRNHCIEMELSSDEWKYNARGSDINRNFPSQLWQPKFKHDFAASENETKALIRLFHKYPTIGFLDFHSRGKSIYYYRSLMSESYNERQLEIASRLQEITGYSLVPPQDEIEAGDTGGNTVHYYSEYFYKPAFTIETVEDEAGFPLAIEYRQPTFEELKLLIFEFGSMIIRELR